MAVQLTYGLNTNNELKHISEVANGQKCNCFCPSCKHPLEARNNGAEREHHFAHVSNKECKGAYESALHLLAKMVLGKTKKLKLPEYCRDTFIKESITVDFDEIEIEKVIEVGKEKIIPDAIGKKNGREIYIEFAKTHFIDENKKEKIKRSGIACIEINLTEQPLDENALSDFFNSDTLLKYWICNLERDKQYNEYIKKEKENIIYRAEQKRIKQANELNEAEIKFNQYLNNKEYKLFKDSEVNFKCPLKKAELSIFKNYSFYQHPILKRIIDGELLWDGKIEGYVPYGKWISINKKREIIYPPDNEYKNLNPQKQETCKLFHKGLIKISPIISSTKYGDCESCKYSVEYLEDLFYEVCKHPTE
jgi:predicted RNA-binding protein YlxR (DUF448 family)